METILKTDSKSAPKFRQGSRNLVRDVAAVTYEGQPEKMRQVKYGFEHTMDFLPVIQENSLNKKGLIMGTQQIMSELSNSLKKTDWVLNEQEEAGEFSRTIIAMEQPIGGKEGVEIVIAKWGDGKTSPIHGHAPGYMHEEILSGKIRVNSYRIVDFEKRIVRPSKTEIVNEGVFVSDFVDVTEQNKDSRSTLVHNFTSIGPSVSLHYLPEHTRDGRDNGFSLEEFPRLTLDDVTRISSFDGMYLKKGEVVLVRSSNIPEYGDHFIVVTGPPIMKEHGLRVQDHSIPASKEQSEFLDETNLRMGLTLYKLNWEARERFFDFHSITMENGNVILPEN